MVEIRNRFNGSVIHSLETQTKPYKLALAEVVMDALSKGIELNDASLGRVNLSNKDLRKSNLKHCDLSRATLVNTDLRGADLEGSVLSLSRLSGANFNGANLKDVIFLGADFGSGVDAYNYKFDRDVVQLRFTGQLVTIWQGYMTIGCECHTIQEWFSFSDERLNEMHGKPLDLFNQWKQIFLDIATSTNRLKLPQQSIKKENNYGILCTV